MLLAYIALLVLGAWRPEIRPDFMDRASDGARRCLESCGLYAGLAVFSSEFNQPGRNRFFKARCLDLIGYREGLPPEIIYPVGATCPPTGIRWYLPPEEIMLTRLFIWAVEDESIRLMENRPRPPAGFVSVPNIVLSSVLYHFDRRERRRGRSYDRFAGRFSHHMTLLDGGDDAIHPIAIFRSGAGSRPGQAVWFPTREQAATLFELPESR